MSRNAYPLRSIVFFMETSLTAMGEQTPATASVSSRGELRARFRGLARLFKEKKRQADPQTWSRIADFATDSQPKRDSGCFEACQGVWGEEKSTAVCVSSSDSVFRRPDLVAEPTPNFSKSLFVAYTQAALPSSVTAKLRLEGVTEFFLAVMELWARRHDAVSPADLKKQPPRRQRAVERLCEAVMRYVFGFFGSHKVDARNTP